MERPVIFHEQGRLKFLGLRGIVKVLMNALKVHLFNEGNANAILQEIGTFADGLPQGFDAVLPVRHMERLFFGKHQRTRARSQGRRADKNIEGVTRIDDDGRNEIGLDSFADRS